MNTITLNHNSEKLIKYITGGLLTAVVLSAALFIQISLNQVFALFLSAIVCTFWINNKVYGLTAATIFFIIKPFWLRLAYHVDISMYGSSGFDLLGVAPTLLLVGFISTNIYLAIIEKKKLCPDKTRILVSLFSALCFLSIFFPTNSIIVGLAGFQRNILPNMLILFLSVSVFKKEKDIMILIKSLAVVGLISILYGIGQYIVGIFPWEILWMKNVGFSNSTAGWLTIGLRGIEFRIFSMFYYRTDFFFTNVLIFSLLLAYGKSFTGYMKFVKTFFYISWFIIMIITFERTPLIMSFMAMLIVYFMNASQAKKKMLITVTITLAIGAYSTLLIFEPYLKSSGVASLIRLAEMTNPLEAGSIHDRTDNYWGPTLDIIKANPIGVGIGHGSGTKASSQLKLADSGNIHTHNELLQKTLETGILGGILFLLLMLSIFKDSLRLSKANDSTHRFGIAMTTCTLVFMMSSMITLTFSGGRGLTFWLLVGVMLSLLSQKQIEQKKLTTSVLKQGEV